MHEVQILQKMAINRKMHYVTNTENSVFVWDSLFWSILASLGWSLVNSVALLHISLSVILLYN